MSKIPFAVLEQALNHLLNLTMNNISAKFWSTNLDLLHLEEINYASHEQKDENYLHIFLDFVEDHLLLSLLIAHAHATQLLLRSLYISYT